MEPLIFKWSISFLGSVVELKRQWKTLTKIFLTHSLKEHLILIKETDPKYAWFSNYKGFTGMKYKAIVYPDQW